MRQREAASLGVDAGHQQAYSSTGTKVTRLRDLIVLGRADRGLMAWVSRGRSSRLYIAPTILTLPVVSSSAMTALRLRIPAYPDAAHELNRWLPLVTWFLAIPHYIVLGVLGVAAVRCIIVARFAILLTGRYPELTV